MGTFQEMFEAMAAAYERDHPGESDPVPPAVSPHAQRRELPPVNAGVMSAHVRTAFHPRQGPSMNNGEHAVLDQPLHSGRLRRETGDALCKPSAKFWGLEQSTNIASVTCGRCAELIERHGIVLRVPQTTD